MTTAVRNRSRAVRPHKPAPRREEVARERMGRKGASESRRMRNDAGRTRPVEVFGVRVIRVGVADGKVFRGGTASARPGEGGRGYGDFFHVPAKVAGDGADSSRVAQTNVAPHENEPDALLRCESPAHGRGKCSQANPGTAGQLRNGGGGIVRRSVGIDSTDQSIVPRPPKNGPKE